MCSRRFLTGRCLHFYFILTLLNVAFAAAAFNSVLFEDLALMDFENDKEQWCSGIHIAWCSNVEVAVRHKRPCCATIIVIGFLVGVVVGIFMCSKEMDEGRRYLRGETFGINDVFAW